MLCCPTYKHSRLPTLGLEQNENQPKTEGIYYVPDLDAAPPEWGMHVADQLLAKADLTWAMHERVQLYQNPQTEFSLLRECLGVNRINHILRVHGYTILQEKEATKILEVGHRSLERLFPGFTEDSFEQATLSANQSGIGYKRTRDVASQAYLGALIAAKSRCGHIGTQTETTFAGASGRFN